MLMVLIRINVNLKELGMHPICQPFGKAMSYSYQIYKSTSLGKKKKSTHKQKASKQQKQKENPLAGPELKAVEESEEKRGREERGSSAPLQHGAPTWHPAGNHSRTYTAFSLSRSALN